MTANAPEPSAWNVNLNNAMQSDGTTPVAPVAPMWDNASFTAGAGGKISTQTYSDGWSMNQLRQLVWTVDGT